MRNLLARNMKECCVFEVCYEHQLKCSDEIEPAGAKGCMLLRVTWPWPHQHETAAPWSFSSCYQMCVVCHPKSCSYEKQTTRKSLASQPLIGSPYSTLYWTDWNREAPKIESSTVDGQNRRVVVSDGIGLPNALTYDASSGQVCWADAGTHEVFSHSRTDNCANVSNRMTALPIFG